MSGKSSSYFTYFIIIIIIIILNVAIAMTINQSHLRARRKYCGTHLPDTMSLFCDETFSLDESHRKRRQSVTNDCCFYACSLEYLLQNYCKTRNDRAIEAFLRGGMFMDNINKLEKQKILHKRSRRRRQRRRQKQKQRCNETKEETDKVKHLLAKNNVPEHLVGYMDYVETEPLLIPFVKIEK